MLLFSKVFAPCFCFLLLFPDILPDICGRLRGENIIKASLRGKYCGFCEQVPVPESIIPRASTNRRGLQPIITEGCSWMGWKCPNGSLPMHSSVDFGWGICTGRVTTDSPVCCDIIRHSNASANRRHSSWFPCHQRLRNRGTAWRTKHIFIRSTTTRFSKYLVTIDKN